MATKKTKAPDAAELLKLAEKESAAPILVDYIDTIRLLRKRGWSYRRVAKWLTDHGVPASFNQVYYAATPIREEGPDFAETWDDLSFEEQDEIMRKQKRDEADRKTDQVFEQREREMGFWPAEEEGKE